MRSPNVCDHRRCRRKAVAAYDMKYSCNNRDQGRHYEVCEKHDKEFFGRGPWIDDKTSERIKAELVPS